MGSGGSGERVLGGVHEKVQAQPLIHCLLRTLFRRNSLVNADLLSFRHQDRSRCAVGFLNEQSCCFTCAENYLIICSVKDGGVTICVNADIHYNVIHKMFIYRFLL